MASAVAGAVLGVAIVATAVRAASFRRELRELQSTLELVRPKIDQIDQLTSENPESFPGEVLLEIERFKRLLMNAKDLVMTCSEIPSRRIWKKYRYAKKIRTLNKSLGNLQEIQGVQLDVIMPVLGRTNKMIETLLREDTSHDSSSIANSPPIESGHRINETVNESKAVNFFCCSWCCFRGPVCLGR